jgi:hypothetical protein
MTFSKEQYCDFLHNLHPNIHTSKCSIDIPHSSLYVRNLFTPILCNFETHIYFLVSSKYNSTFMSIDSNIIKGAQGSIYWPRYLIICPPHTVRLHKLQFQIIQEFKCHITLKKYWKDGSYILYIL